MIMNLQGLCSESVDYLSNCKLLKQASAVASNTNRRTKGRACDCGGGVGGPRVAQRQQKADATICTCGAVSLCILN
jgi:hypothetical protein